MNKTMGIIITCTMFVVMTALLWPCTANAGTDSEIAHITIVNVNRAPALNPIRDQAVNEGVTLTFTLTAVDPDGGAVTFHSAALPQGASLDTATGEFTWTPQHDQSGIHSVSFTAQDVQGLSSNPVSISIAVVDANRPPVLDPIPAIQVNENETITITPQASDPDGDTLVYSVTGLPVGADYDFDPATGELVWRTTYDEADDYDITFTVDDGK